MKARSKSLFVSRFSPDVTAFDVENLLNAQLQLASLSCTRLKSKHDSYSSFHVSVTEDYFNLINNTAVWPKGCLIAPYYGRLNPEQIYNDATSVASRRPTPGAGDRPPAPQSPEALADAVSAVRGSS
jgi:hypothetical protein